MKNTIVLLLFPFLMFGQTQIGDDIDGEAAGDESAYSFSLSGDGSKLAIGARRNNGNGNGSGHVRVYENIGGIWTQIGNDIDGVEEVELSGMSVSLSNDGNTVAIGAPNNDGNGMNSGQVRVYKNISGDWTQVGNGINGESASNNSGITVSLSGNGNFVAISSRAVNNNTGHVRIYENISGNWLQIGENIEGTSAGNQFGFSVSLSNTGDIVAISSSNYTGYVRIYENISGNWLQLGDDIYGEGANDNSGFNINLSDNGSIVAIGAPLNDGNGINSGHARIYKFVNNIWVQLGDDIDGEYEFNEFGSSVSLSSDGSIIAIGAIRNNDNGYNSGQAYIYQFINGEWIKVGDDIDGEDLYDQFGYNVSLSSDGKIVAIGTPLNDGNGVNSGHVRVYDLSQILSLNEQITENNFTIYPNPASKNITIKLIENQEVSLVNIFNNLGQLVQTETTTSIDISGLVSGSYYVQVTTSEGVSAEKLLVE